MGFGVGSKGGESRGSLPTVSSSKGWLRDPQRFPVIISFDQEQVGGLRRAGGQADVVVYTGGNILLNAIAWAQIRFRSWMSYVR